MQIAAASTKGHSMVLTDTFGKSVLLSPVINLTELEYMINDIETFIGGVTNEIDFAQSTLERLRARLTHVGLSSAYKFYNPEKNNDKVYKEGNLSVPEYAPPRKGIYDGRNDSIAMMVKEDTTSPIPEAVPVIDLQIRVSYFFLLGFHYAISHTYNIWISYYFLFCLYVSDKIPYHRIVFHWPRMSETE